MWNALAMRLYRVIFAPSAMASSRQQPADPPQHSADGSMRRRLNALRIIRRRHGQL
jgi:hypothetical protein